MSNFKSSCNPSIFYDFAKNRIDLWKQLVVNRFIHNTFGERIIPIKDIGY